MEWKYIKDEGLPKKSGRYLFSYGKPEYGEGAVEVLYWNRQQKTIFTLGGRDEDGNPTTITTAYAWAEVPKAAPYVD